MEPLGEILEVRLYRHSTAADVIDSCLKFLHEDGMVGQVEAVKNDWRLLADLQGFEKVRSLYFRAFLCVLSENTLAH